MNRFKLCEFTRCYKGTILIKAESAHTMNQVTVINRPTRNGADKGAKGNSIHNTIRECARRELEKLSAEFFDAVDDFLFLSGTNGQFVEDSTYLRAMREMRAKQSLFEEAFLQLTLATLFPLSKEASKEQLSAPRHLIDRHAAVFEMLEIDLALRAMHRKAQKQYADFHGQIDALVAKLPSVSPAEAHKQFALVSSSLWAFGESQRIFNLPLEIRLVVIKLFEQHFLLKLEPLFQSAISVLKSAHSGNTASKPNLTIARYESRPGPATKFAAQPADRGKRDDRPVLDIDGLVEDVVREVCDGEEICSLVTNIIESKWRGVLFLIGVNRGTTSEDWLEAKNTLQLLVAMSVGKCTVGSANLKLLEKRLCEGFELLQMPQNEQSQIIRDVNAVMSPAPAAKSSAPAQSATKTTPAEASVSPAGKQILDREDIREICDMLDASSGDIASPSMEDDLLACLPDLDAPGASATIEYKINGTFQVCSLKRNVLKPEMYNITDRQSKITITRSRLGLAISLKAGELRFTPSRSRSVVSKTVFEISGTKSDSN